MDFNLTDDRRMLADTLSRYLQDHYSIAARNDAPTAADQSVAEAQARSLEREADAARALFQEFLVRASETETQTEIQRPDARVLSRADAPSRPAFSARRVESSAVVSIWPTLRYIGGRSWSFAWMGEIPGSERSPSDPA